MPHTNNKAGKQKWRHNNKGVKNNNKRKRKHDDDQDKSISKVIKEKRLAKKRKQEMKEKETEMLEELETLYEELLKKSTRTLLDFDDFPLSWRTREGLTENDYTKPTEIQRETLAYSLSGSDVVGAAKTGSGKTLALVIPILEKLWKSRWMTTDGLGALVISPTRELALQTFCAINAVGKHHGFSCGLVIGGSEVSFEKNRISGVNIVVCTPGRLLQHMDENEQFNCDSLQILVLDEADRMLDMGFSKQLNSIIDNLPSERQSLLFSATQTRNVKDLCRVCTNNPVFVSVHENASAATPDNLKQSYVVTEEESKINTLWSFIQAHRKKKSLVFVSSCKQARFLTDAFSQLRPGLPIMGLWGNMNQKKRIETFTKFDESKAAVLIATDVASRGLDFEHIEWVIQVDCPAAIDDYIHRVGRSARMEDSGNSLLMVTSSQQEAMISKLKKNNIPIEELRIDPKAVSDIRSKLRAIVAESQELKEFAQKSIVAYLRAVFTMRDKKIFDVNSIDTSALADSYGLVSVPRVRFLDKKKNDDSNAATTVKKSKVEIPNEDDENEEDKQSSLVGNFTIDDDNEDIFVLKNKDSSSHEMETNIVEKEDENEVEEGIKEEIVTLKKGKPLKKALTKAAVAKKILNKKLRVNTKTTFSDEDDYADSKIKQNVEGPSTISSYGLDIEKAKKEMKAIDKTDRKRFKELRQQKRAEKLAKRNRKTEDVDVEDDGDDDIDLSWLPDPDAVKKKYENDNSDDEDEPMETNYLEKEALKLLSRK